MFPGLQRPLLARFKSHAPANGGPVPGASGLRVRRDAGTRRPGDACHLTPGVWPSLHGVLAALSASLARGLAALQNTLDVADD